MGTILISCLRYVEDVSHIQGYVNYKGLIKVAFMAFAVHGDKNRRSITFALEYLFFIYRKSPVSGESLPSYTSNADFQPESLLLQS